MHFAFNALWPREDTAPSPRLRASGESGGSSTGSELSSPESAEREHNVALDETTGTEASVDDGRSSDSDYVPSSSEDELDGAQLQDDYG